MKTKPIFRALGLGAVIVCSAPQAATYEAGLLGHILWADSSRQYVDDSFGVALDGLRLWSPYEGISLRVSADVLKTDFPDSYIGNPSDFIRQTVTVGYWRYLDGDGFDISGFRPYVNGAIGIGHQETIRSEFEEDSGLLLEAAGGVVSKWDVLIPNLKFRSELRLNWEDVYGGAFDVALGAGLHYTFGGMAPAAPAKPAPAAAPAAPAPAPAPTPAPAPAPVKDSDRDGVNDDKDACPGTATGAKVDERGCVRLEKLALKGVAFGSGSATITPTSYDTLRGVAATLRANPSTKVEVGGYTDSAGDDAKNLALSERRAQAVKSFLIKEGVAAGQLSAKGYGEASPIDTNDTPAGRANNRRVELKVL